MAKRKMMTKKSILDSIKYTEKLLEEKRKEANPDWYLIGRLDAMYFVLGVDKRYRTE